MNDLPPHLRRVAPEVLYTAEPIVAAGRETVDLLKRIARDSPRGRCRLCAHPEPAAEQQEMLIVMHRDTYVRPHRHFGKSETFTVFEGEADAVIFSDTGKVTRLLPMGTYGSGKLFFYRMPEGVFHTLIFRSEWLVYLETTAGPFVPSKSEGAPWAPEETDIEAGRAYIARLQLPKQ